MPTFLVYANKADNGSTFQQPQGLFYFFNKLLMYTQRAI